METKPYPIYGIPDLGAVAQMNEAMKYDAVRGALMADHHLGYSVPIGAVIAYEGKICVNGVGFDIGCGNKAVRTNADALRIRTDMRRIMNDVQKHISFGVGRKNAEIVDHELFDDPSWECIDALKSLKDKARSQLGTVGSGNHYVDIFVSDDDAIWIGCHFGSRGLGHSICKYFIEYGGGKDGIHAPPVILDERSDLGEQYIRCMQLAGRYAYAGRDWVCARVARILGTTILEEVHNHHNFAWREQHDGEDLWVVRKGATPNYVGSRSFVGGSMGDMSFILEGVESQQSKDTMYSTIHGAGRLIGRMEARGKIDRKTGEVIRLGTVTKKGMKEWIDRFDVEVRGGDVDEAPQCYRRIEPVINAHRDSVKVVHTLKPIGVCMADDRDVDPYKD